MSPTFEAVLNQAKTLKSEERAELIKALSQSSSKENGGTKKGHREKIRAFRGRYRHILPSSKEFLDAKREEILLEER